MHTCSNVVPHTLTKPEPWRTTSAVITSVFALYSGWCKLPAGKNATDLRLLRVEAGRDGRKSEGEGGFDLCDCRLRAVWRDAKDIVGILEQDLRLGHGHRRRGLRRSPM